MRQSTSNRTIEGNGASTPLISNAPGGWAASEPATAWQDAAAAGGRWWIAAAGGLGFLACVAVGALVVRAVSGPSLDKLCADGVSCNAAGAGYAQAPNASDADQVLAARLFQRGCEMGHAPACNNLGLAYESAQGVPQDYVQAMNAFERACSGGFAEGCSNQGTLHEHGLGVPVNLGDAQRAYTQACRRGSALGCSNLGVLYAEGRGVPSDDGMAVRLFSEACRGGSQVGCANLFEAEHESSERRFR